LVTFILGNKMLLTQQILLRLIVFFYHPTSDLRESLSSIRRTVETRHGEEVADQMISGCLFLRYLCPALHGPTLFGLTNAVPDEPRVSRNLTLIAKVLQTMANFSHFEAKENYMRFMNEFVVAMRDEMRAFLRAISTTAGTDVNPDIWIKRTNATYNCHSSIDLGYELTMMHRYLSAVVEAHPNVSHSSSADLIIHP
uniref:Ras-GAP domain-containing protein n=1 Tax=Schistocephalus solidus TaxID=70667 RepID=A0A183TFY9_SCHSO